MEANSWPEQDAIDKWFLKYGIVIQHEKLMELKSAVSQYRIQLQDELNELRKLKGEG